MNVESRLAEIIGPVAGRLHTARSRNDQVATDFRLLVRDALDDIDAQLADLQLALAEKALEEAGSVMPGFTHLQSAQPVTFGHHLLAYVEMLGARPRALPDARARLERMSARRGGARRHLLPDRSRDDGAGARLRRGRRRIRSTASPIAISCWRRCRRRRSARRISRASPRRSCCGRRRNSPSSRCRDKFTTGSSIMPQKRNPDAAELVRGKTGRIIGALQAHADRDEGPAARLFQGHAGGQGRHFRRARQFLSLCVAAMAGMVRDMSVDRAAHAQGGRRRLRDRDRSRRLAGARARPAVPRGASCDGPHRRASRRSATSGSRSCRSRRCRRSSRASRRMCSSVLGVEKSVKSRDELWRHGAGRMCASRRAAG